MKKSEDCYSLLNTRHATILNVKASFLYKIIIQIVIHVLVCLCSIRVLFSLKKIVDHSEEQNLLKDNNQP